MSSKVDIWNMALGHIAQSSAISSDTEKSTERYVCERFWEASYRSTLRDYDLPFSRKVASLQLVSTNPTTEWAYSYKYPNDCLRFRRIVSGQVQDSLKSRIPFEITQSDSGGQLFIYTNEATPKGRYTVDSDLISLWPEDFQMAVSLRLAAYIAPSITKGDPFGLGKRAFDFYVQHIDMAASNAQSEEHQGDGPLNTFTESRS